MVVNQEGLDVLMVLYCHTCDDLFVRLPDEAPQHRCPRVRSTTGLMGWEGRFLPPLPDTEVVTVDDFPVVKRYRLLAALMAAGIWAAAMLSSKYGPSFVRWSPLTGAVSAAEGVGGETATIVSAIVVVFMMMVLVGLVGVMLFYPRLRYRLALVEEDRYRFGAENWSWRQRIVSTFLFGFGHVLNLFMAVATLGFLSVVGFVFLLVYLRTERRTGDNRYALAVTARLHADYNLYVVLMLVSFLVRTLVLMAVG